MRCVIALSRFPRRCAGFLLILFTVLFRFVGILMIVA